jgi:hypothetical protein
MAESLYGCSRHPVVELCVRIALIGVCLEGELDSGGSDRAHWCSVVD